jgi:general L-amino acid transport system substrate-binding protein
MFPAKVISGRTAALALAMTLGGAAVAQAGTLDTVKQRGNLVCGVSQGLLGFSAKDDAGKWSGFDVDFCRAVAAAIFNDAEKVTYVPLSAAERFDALKDGKVDLLSRNSTWTMGRETDLPLAFVGVNYYDGQGFMVKRDSGKLSALELDGATVCVQSGTTSEQNYVDYFNTNTMAFTTVAASSPEESLANYKSGKCNVITTDVSQLYSERAALADGDEHVILPDVISKEPLGPVVRQDDPKWRTLVAWVHNAMLNAEELGVTSERVDEAKASKKPDVMRLVGTEGGFGEKLGLSNDWAINIVATVGNYGESYERNLGVDSKLGIPRGLNQLWSLGGIQYAPPIR